MSLEYISAEFCCDECSTFFSVDLDAAYEPPKDWCLMDVAEDQIRAGMESIVEGEHFCRACTAKHDEADAA